MNTDPVLPSNDIDEYEVVNSKDEFDKHNLPINEEEDNGTSQKKTQDFSSTHDNMIQEELQQVTD